MVDQERHSDVKHLKPITLLVALAVIAAACGGTADTTPIETAPPTSTPAPPTSLPPPSDSVPGLGAFTPGQVLEADLPRAVPLVEPAVMEAVVAGDAQFGLDLFGVIAGDDNTMISPYSIATALSMLFAGAQGTTADEIAAALHLTVDDETLHMVRSAIDNALAGVPEPIGDEDTREPFAIRPANAAWGQGGYAFLDAYLETLATHYGAGLRLLDFVHDPAGSTDLINRWVEDATEDRIRDLVPPGVIDELTRLVLVNAIWFKANWAEKFDPEQTAPGVFTKLDGTEVTVPLMHQNLRTNYAENDRFTAVRLRYAGDASMVVALPKTGSPAELAATLTPSDLAGLGGDFQVDLTLPSFEFEADVTLKQALQALGIKAAFVPPLTGAADEADLTGIAAIRELFVADALHKSFIALDENGTEAAAATAIIVSATSLPESASFTADRPFLFWIQHDPTGEILFLGQVTDPS